MIHIIQNCVLIRSVDYSLFLLFLSGHAHLIFTVSEMKLELKQGIHNEVSLTEFKALREKKHVFGDQEFNIVLIKKYIFNISSLMQIYVKVLIYIVKYIFLNIII